MIRLWTLCIGFLSIQAQALQLTPQSVIDVMLKQGHDKKLIEYEAKKSDLLVGQKESVFDSGMQLSTGYSIDQTENISGISNIEDQNIASSIKFSKKFSTGTQLTAGIEQLTQDSVLAVGSSSLPNKTLDTATIEIQQQILNNGFGKVDRNELKKAQLQVDTAYLMSEEKLEDLVLNTLEIFWSTYAAKENLSEAIEARKLIGNLVATVKRKARIGNVTPGELPRVQAEFELQDQTVKQASVAYLNQLNILLTKLNLPMSEDIELIIDEKLPPVPQATTFNFDNSRSMKAAANSVLSSEMTLKNAESLSYPELFFNFKWSATGFDADPDLALSELTSATQPLYYAGLTLRFYLNSSVTNLSVSHHKVTLEDSKVKSVQLKQNMQLQLDNAYRELQALYKIALSSKKAVKLREKAAKDMNKAFKQARIDLNTVIIGYREFFAEKVKLARAQGDYRIALNKYAAIKDELIEPNKISHKKSGE